MGWGVIAPQAWLLVLGARNLGLESPPNCQWPQHTVSLPWPQHTVTSPITPATPSFAGLAKWGAQ